MLKRGMKNSHKNLSVEKNGKLINSPVNDPETTVQVVSKQMSNTAQKSDKQVAPRRIEPIKLINKEKIVLGMPFLIQLILQYFTIIIGNVVILKWFVKENSLKRKMILFAC